MGCPNFKQMCNPTTKPANKADQAAVSKAVQAQKFQTDSVAGPSVDVPEKDVDQSAIFSKTEDQDSEAGMMSRLVKLEHLTFGKEETSGTSTDRFRQFASLWLSKVDRHGSEAEVIEKCEAACQGSPTKSSQPSDSRRER